MLIKAALSILLSAAACRSAVLIREEELPGAEKEPLIGPCGPRGEWSWDARKPGYVRMPVSRHVFNGTDRWKWGWHWSPGPGGPSGPWGWPPSGPLPGSPVSTPGQSPNPWPSYSAPPGYPGGWPGFPYPTGTSLTTSTRQGGSTPPGQSTPSSASAPTKAILGPRATPDGGWGWQPLEDMGVAYILERTHHIFLISWSPNTDTCLPYSGHRNPTPKDQSLHRHRLLRAVGQSKMQHVSRCRFVPELRQLPP